MHDTFLLNKISQSLKTICEENKLQRIEHFTLVVNHHSHINEENLLEHLIIHNNDIISNKLKIEIQKEAIEDQTAIIKSIQGETFEI
jgi:Zn finger protein HypA/HybF involved in hydrogenase expression